ILFASPLAFACSSSAGGGNPMSGTHDPGPGGVIFSVSGEELAFSGYDFPPANDGDPTFVDGWDVKFDRLLVTVDKITVSENPNMVPTDQSQNGPLVAEVDGPWAV